MDTQEPLFVLFAPDLIPSISPVVESALHFALLSEIAAIAGTGQESVKFALSHVESMLDDVFFDDVAEDHRTELVAVLEYAKNATQAAHTTPEDCYGAIKPLVKALADLQERVAGYSLYDAMFAEFGGAA